MLFYNLIVLSMFMGLTFYETMKRSANKFSQEVYDLVDSVFFVSPLVLVMGFRYGVGTDYHTYESIFHRITTSDISNEVLNVETGYYYLNKISYFISGNPQLIFFLTSVIIMTFYYLGIKKRSINTSLSYFCFIGLTYYFNAMNGMRQFIAVSIIFYAYSFSEKKVIPKFIIWCLVASLFHKSVLIMIPIVIFLKYSSNKLFFWSSTIFGVIVAISSKFIFDILNRFNIYTFYINAPSFLNKDFSIFNIALAGSILILGFVYKEKIFKNEILLYRYKLVWLALILFTCFTDFGMFTTRFGYYLTCTYLVFIPDLLHLIQNRKIGLLLKTSLIVGLLILYYYLIFTNNNGGLYILPYHYRGLF